MKMPRRAISWAFLRSFFFYLSHNGVGDAYHHRKHCQGLQNSKWSFRPVALFPLAASTLRELHTVCIQRELARLHLAR